MWQGAYQLVSQVGRMLRDSGVVSWNERLAQIDRRLQKHHWHLSLAVDDLSAVLDLDEATVAAAMSRTREEMGELRRVIAEVIPVVMAEMADAVLPVLMDPAAPATTTADELRRDSQLMLASLSRVAAATEELTRLLRTVSTVLPRDERGAGTLLPSPVVAVTAPVAAPPPGMDPADPASPGSPGSPAGSVAPASSVAPTGSVSSASPGPADVARLCWKLLEDSRVARDIADRGLPGQRIECSSWFEGSPALPPTLDLAQVCVLAEAAAKRLAQDTVAWPEDPAVREEFVTLIHLTRTGIPKLLDQIVRSATERVHLLAERDDLTRGTATLHTTLLASRGLWNTSRDLRLAIDTWIQRSAPASPALPVVEEPADHGPALDALIDWIAAVLNGREQLVTHEPAPEAAPDTPGPDEASAETPHREPVTSSIPETTPDQAVQGGPAYDGSADHPETVSAAPPDPFVSYEPVPEPTPDQPDPDQPDLAMPDLAMHDLAMHDLAMHDTAMHDTVPDATTDQPVPYEPVPGTAPGPLDAAAYDSTFDPQSDPHAVDASPSATPGDPSPHPDEPGHDAGWT